MDMATELPGSTSLRELKNSCSEAPMGIRVQLNRMAPEIFYPQTSISIASPLGF